MPLAGHELMALGSSNSTTKTREKFMEFDVYERNVQTVGVANEVFEPFPKTHSQKRSGNAAAGHSQE